MSLVCTCGMNFYHSADFKSHQKLDKTHKHKVCCSRCRKVLNPAKEDVHKYEFNQKVYSLLCDNCYVIIFENIANGGNGKKKR